jgi:hypothetical protein
MVTCSFYGCPRFSGTPIFQVKASLRWIQCQILITIPRPESTTLAAACPGQVTPCNQWRDGTYTTYTTYLVTGADSFTHTSIYPKKTEVRKMLLN